MAQNNPFGGFNHQTANYIQQQRLAAYQRQMQELGNHGIQGTNQFPPTTSSSNQSPAPPSNENSNKSINNTDSNASTNRSTPPVKPQQTFPMPSPQAGKTSANQLSTQTGSNENKLPQSDAPQSSRSNTPIKVSMISSLQELFIFLYCLYFILLSLNLFFFFFYLLI